MSSLNDWNKTIIKEFKENDGVVGGQFSGVPLLLLHTTGAKSGQARINPVVYDADGERFVVIASKAGAPSNPDWYYNLVANPDVSVEVGTEQFQAQATVAAEPKRTELYEQIASKYPFFEEYKSKTTRTIPVVILTRKS